MRALSPAVGCPSGAWQGEAAQAPGRLYILPTSGTAAPGVDAIGTLGERFAGQKGAAATSHTARPVPPCCCMCWRAMRRHGVYSRCCQAARPSALPALGIFRGVEGSSSSSSCCWGCSRRCWPTQARRAAPALSTRQGSPYGIMTWLSRSTVRHARLHATVGVQSIPSVAHAHM